MTKKLLALNVSGEPDPVNDGMLLVSINGQHDKNKVWKRTFPNLSDDRPANTYYRYDPASQRVYDMVTICPEGYMIAWDLCGVCMNHIRVCSCSNGAGTPSYVWIASGGRPKPEAEDPEVLAEWVKRRRAPKVEEPQPRQLLKRQPKKLERKPTVAHVPDMKSIDDAAGAEVAAMLGEIGTRLVRKPLLKRKKK